MTFAQALARIEELLNDSEPNYLAIEGILGQHADSIVQLARAAEEMRDTLEVYGEPANYERAHDPDPETHPIWVLDDQGEEARNSLAAYNALMKKGGE